MENIEVTYDGNFELSMQGPKGKERLKINGEYPNTTLSRLLFSQLGLMHLIAPYNPTTVQINFDLLAEIRSLINAMYESEKRDAPFFARWPEFAITRLDPFSPPKSNKVAIAYSAGKDSMWNLWWAQEKYGPENVLVVHIKGLNQGQTSEEFKYTKRQQKKIGFKLKIIELANGSKNFGFKVMRSRDMFLAGIIIPVALEFGASKVIIEGFTEADPREMFTGQEKNMRYFNRVLKEMHVSAQVVWRSDCKEMDTIKDLLIHRPNWLPHVCNCFSIPCYKLFLRKSWKNRTPTLARLFYDSQCGSCIKCRVIILARILYDPAMKSVKDDDIRFYLKNTAQWIKKKYSTHADMIEGSFTEYFNKAVEKYNLKNLKSSYS